MHREWIATTVGLVTTVADLIGVALQTPLGAVIDAARDKRMGIVVALRAAWAGAAVIAILYQPSLIRTHGPIGLVRWT